MAVRHGQRGVMDASSQAPMEATKPARKHDRHCHDTHPKNDHVLGVPQVELPHAAHELSDGYFHGPPDYFSDTSPLA